MKINNTIDDTIEGDVAVIAAESPPVNAFSAHVRQGLADCVGQAINDREVRALVVICLGRTYFAGAYITEFGKPPVPPLLQDLLGPIEDAAKPGIAGPPRWCDRRPHSCQYGARTPQKEGALWT
jgi:3-hydroxyacyl-CoA dehydrogenase